MAFQHPAAPLARSHTRSVWSSDHDSALAPSGSNSAPKPNAHGLPAPGSPARQVPYPQRLVIDQDSALTPSDSKAHPEPDPYGLPAPGSAARQVPHAQRLVIRPGQRAHPIRQQQRTPNRPNGLPAPGQRRSPGPTPAASGLRPDSAPARPAASVHRKPIHMAFQRPAAPLPRSHTRNVCRSTTTAPHPIRQQQRALNQTPCPCSTRLPPLARSHTRNVQSCDHDSALTPSDSNTHPKPTRMAFQHPARAAR